MLDKRLTTYIGANLMKKLLKAKDRNDLDAVEKIEKQIADYQRDVMTWRPE